MAEDANATTSARLDIWLDVSCLFKTRSTRRKPSAPARSSSTATRRRIARFAPGDDLVIARQFGCSRPFTSSPWPDTHMSSADARTTYEDRTPAPTPEEIEMRKLERMRTRPRSPADDAGPQPARRAPQAYEGKPNLD